MVGGDRIELPPHSVNEDLPQLDTEPYVVWHTRSRARALGSRCGSGARQINRLNLFPILKGIGEPHFFGPGFGEDFIQAFCKLLVRAFI